MAWPWIVFDIIMGVIIVVCIALIIGTELWGWTDGPG